MFIRKANKSDIDVAWDIRKESIKAECVEYYPSEVIEPWLNGSLPEGFASELESNFFVASQGDEIIGLGALSGAVPLGKCTYLWPIVRYVSL